VDVKEMVESIVRELINALPQKAEPPKVLFVFCDSSAHEAFSDQFIALANRGVCYDLLCLDGEASGWLGMSRIECGGAGKLIAADEYAPAPIELPKEYDGVVIPELDLDNASRIALGLKGTIKAEIVFSALVLGKFVIVGEDAPGIKRADRRCLKTLTLPPPLQRRFQQQLAELRELGVEVTPQKELAAAVLRKLQNRVDAAGRAAALPGDEPAVVEFTGKLLHADWLLNRPHLAGKQVLLPPGAIITPMARDVLQEKGMSVQHSGKG